MRTVSMLTVSNFRHSLDANPGYEVKFNPQSMHSRPIGITSGSWIQVPFMACRVKQICKNYAFVEVKWKKIYAGADRISSLFVAC